MGGGQNTCDCTGDGGSSPSLPILYNTSKSRSYLKEFSPDIGYETTHSNFTNNKDLRRAFGKEKKLWGRTYGTYYASYVEIKRICDFLQIPETIFLESMYLYQKLHKSGFIKRTHIKYAILDACVLASCRMNRFPISIREIYDISAESPERIRKAYKKIVIFLNLKIPHLSLVDYIFYFCNKFKMDVSQTIKAVEIANKVMVKCNMSGKKTNGYAAAVIKKVTGETYDDLAKKMGVVNTTICARFNEIKKIWND